MLPIAILAGGLGTRLGRLTQSIPKCMVPINGVPFIDWQIQLLRSAGFEDFVFCISHLSDEIQNYLQDGSKFGIKISYSLDGEMQLGTGGALVKALPLLGSEFAVTYGDSYLPINYSNAELFFKQSSAPGMMSVFKNCGQFDVSNAELLADGFVNYKKGSNDSQMNYIDYGLMYFRAEAFGAVSRNQPMELAAICAHLSESKKLIGFEVFKRFYEIGSVKGIEELSSYLLESKNEF
jgi:MurNAc alpha-1-phosphate uridylyltransferase